MNGSVQEKGSVSKAGLIGEVDATGLVDAGLLKKSADLMLPPPLLLPLPLLLLTAPLGVDSIEGGLTSSPRRSPSEIQPLLGLLAVLSLVLVDTEALKAAADCTD